MKNLKNYKIETLGLNEAILHKAVEEGYNDGRLSWTLNNAKYLYLYKDGDVTMDNTERYFNDHKHPQISAHDFLRLNWTPKVGEEVEIVEIGLGDSFRGCVDKLGKFTIESVNIDFGDGWYGIDTTIVRCYYRVRLIPIYPRKKQLRESSLRFKTEAEFIEEFGEGWRDEITPNWCYGMNNLFGKPANKNTPYDVDNDKWLFDDWVISDDMLTDKPLPEQKQDKPDAYIENVPNSLGLRIVYRHNNEEFVDSDVRNAYQYHLMHPKVYKAKYPDLSKEELLRGQFKTETNQKLWTENFEESAGFSDAYVYWLENKL